MQMLTRLIADTVVRVEIALGACVVPAFVVCWMCAGRRDDPHDGDDGGAGDDADAACLLAVAVSVLAPRSDQRGARQGAGPTGICSLDYRRNHRLHLEQPRASHTRALVRDLGLDYDCFCLGRCLSSPAITSGSTLNGQRSFGLSGLEPAPPRVPIPPRE